MDDLAPDILRQRLLLEGYYTVAVDEAVIAQYFEALTGELSLRAYGAPTIFAPAGEGRAENQGYDAFIPLIDSGISLYVWTTKKFLALVVFTCKSFDAQHAVRTTRDFFGMTTVVHEQF
jgi:hypothetical protein